MPTYRIVYAGLPESARRIEAASERDAVCAFFAARPRANTIIVHRRWLRQSYHRGRDLLAELPELAGIDLQHELAVVPASNPARDPFVIAARAALVLFALGGIGFAVKLYRDDQPLVFVLVLLVAALSLLLFSLCISSATLRAQLTRSDEPWE